MFVYYSIRKGKEIMSLLDKDLTELESVGTALDSKTGMTYPMYVDGTHDEEMGVHLEDIDEEWFHSLSSEDNIIVNEVMLELEIS
jgi:hypothetical protein